MRFLPHEHAAITLALGAHGVDPHMILFVKRRGRLHVQVPGRTKPFVFFREKSTKLNDQGQWQERTHYFVGATNGKPCDWEEVMQDLQEWLSS